MKHWPRTSPVIAALLLLLAGCTTSGMSRQTTHLSAQQCIDLTALRASAPPNHARNMSELAALHEAGYNPGLWDDPLYPQDLEDAQHRVDYWYQTECPQARQQH